MRDSQIQLLQTELSSKEAAIAALQPCLRQKSRNPCPRKPGLLWLSRISITRGRKQRGDASGVSVRNVLMGALLCHSQYITSGKRVVLGESVCCTCSSRLASTGTAHADICMDFVFSLCEALTHYRYDPKPGSPSAESEC